jgi:hypothetical protein
MLVSSDRFISVRCRISLFRFSAAFVVIKLCCFLQVFCLFRNYSAPSQVENQGEDRDSQSELDMLGITDEMLAGHLAQKCSFMP